MSVPSLVMPYPQETPKGISVFVVEARIEACLSILEI
jgi:hypothetical protein